MISTISSFLVLVIVAAVYCNPVENDVELAKHAPAELTTVICASNLPTDAELQLLETIKAVHGNYFNNNLTAEAVSGLFRYRSRDCAWNVVIYPKPANELPDELVAIFVGVPKSGYVCILVNNTLYYYLFSSPQPTRRCEF